jgi:hypothetical protein
MYIYNPYDRYKAFRMFEADFINELVKLCQIWLPSVRYIIKKWLKILSGNCRYSLLDNLFKYVLCAWLLFLNVVCVCVWNISADNSPISVVSAESVGLPWRWIFRAPKCYEMPPLESFFREIRLLHLDFQKTKYLEFVEYVLLNYV